MRENVLSGFVSTLMLGSFTCMMYTMIRAHHRGNKSRQTREPLCILTLEYTGLRTDKVVSRHADLPDLTVDESGCRSYRPLALVPPAEPPALEAPF